MSHHGSRGDEICIDAGDDPDARKRIIPIQGIEWHEGCIVLIPESKLEKAGGQ